MKHDSIKTNKKLGQHWLNDQASLDAMIEISNIDLSDHVVEIGPGPGALTEMLVTRAKNVVAVEFDASLASDLPKRVRADNLQVVNQDILRFNFAEMPTDYKVVANIPYYLTSNLIRVLSETANPPRSISLLIQKEVAERIAAAPGDMSLLSVTAQMYFEPLLGAIVPAEAFTPPPKVDSQIIHLSRRDQPLFGQFDHKLLFRIVKAGFSNRRKTIHNSLSAGLQIDKNQTKQLLESVDINPGHRAQELDLNQWITLAQKIQSSTE